MRWNRRTEMNMRPLLIDDAMVWNGTGALPFRRKVLVEGERIAAVATQAEAIAADGVERVEAKGAFLMRDMVEGPPHNRHLN
jgi:N-acyl-D-aspartate/D-glutamate deacylase